MIHETVRRMINTLVIDLIEQSTRRHCRGRARSASTTCAPRRRWSAFSPELRAEQRELKCSCASISTATTR